VWKEPQGVLGSSVQGTDPYEGDGRRWNGESKGDRTIDNRRREMSKETKVEVKTYILRLICECGGDMMPTGECMSSKPPQYPHRCARCGSMETVSDKYYPVTTFEEVGI
jgi:hypothetical protein